MISSILGGIGIFLLGMLLMTDGLKTAAGNELRNLLVRFTGGHFKAIASGAAMTALVQSSSATTLATIGFVSAGLLTFSQAVGVIFGANLGTTSTGWIVSLIGLKLNVSVVALPLVGVGALVRLLAGGRLSAAGSAIAGFGLIFVGIDTLQRGMQTLAEEVNPSTLGGHSIGGRLILVGVGALMTVIMQSSSAAMATTLTALDAGTIGLSEGAALVIGQNIGTTVTAGIAAIGASVAAKRTAAAHVAFNIGTGVIAFSALPLLLAVTARVTPADPAAALALFHTVFNVLGILVFVPLIGRLSSMIIRIIPERGPHLTRHLDPSVATVPAVALETAARTVEEIAAHVLVSLKASMTAAARLRHHDQIAVADAALRSTRRFLALLRTSPDTASEYRRHLSLLHAMDHLDALIDLARDVRAHSDDGLGEVVADAIWRLEQVISSAMKGMDGLTAARAGELAAQLATMRVEERKAVLERTALGSIDPEEADVQLEMLRWIERVGHHLGRALHYLAGGDGSAQAGQLQEERSEPRPEPRIDDSEGG